MAWALFDGEKKVSKSHVHKEAVYIEALEKGFVLISKGDRWLKDGSSIREINYKDYPEIKEPKIGDKTQAYDGYLGVITAFDDKECYDVVITHRVHKDHLTWDDRIKAWRYP